MPSLSRISLYLTTLLSGLSQGQNPEQGIQVRTIAPALFEDISEVELRADDTTLISLEISTGQLRTGSSLRIREFDVGIAIGDHFRKLGSVTLPPSGRDFILVFLPTTDAYNILPISADSPSFKPNDSMVFNFMDKEIGVALGTAKAQIKPKSSAIITPGITTDETFFIASFFIRENKTFLPFNNTRWPVNSALKNLLFVFPDPESGDPRYKGVIIEASSTNG